LLIGIIFTWKTLTATREGQITDRFIRAVDQLGARDKNGNPATEIRIGGIYGLVRVAHESSQDYEPILAILDDYVRLNAPVEEKSVPRVWNKLIHVRPRMDVQAALSFLVERPIFPPAHLNLSHTDLSGADLRNAHLEHADLTDANLDSADLTNAHLDEAQLQDDTQLVRTELINAHLEGAYLTHARLEGADLYGAYLTSAFLTSADLKHAILWHAHLELAVLDGAKLEDVHLSGAHLENSDLRGADFGNGKNYELTQPQIDSACGDEMTQLPVGFNKPKSWHGRWPCHIETLPPAWRRAFRRMVSQ
jgi:hypothetical protein